MEPKYNASSSLNKYILLILLLIVVTAILYSIFGLDKPLNENHELEREGFIKNNVQLSQPTVKESITLENSAEVNVDLESFTKEELLKKYNGKLVDVTGGKMIRGHDFSSIPEGAFQFYLSEDDVYNLHAKIQNLPDLQNDEFYEGWVVQASPFKFTSTGRLVKIDDGTFENSFNSPIDYSNYKMYILTLEPNDGNPEPADHIVEGFSIDLEE